MIKKYVKFGGRYKLNRPNKLYVSRGHELIKTSNFTIVLNI